MSGNNGVNIVHQLAQREKDTLYNLRDGLILNRMRVAKSLYRKNLSGHFGCVNAIEFSHNGGSLLASGWYNSHLKPWTY